MMTLIPDPERPGCLVNPDWRPGTAGTFAVIVGVSEYRHLKGGPEAVAVNHGLGQLYVSALTAYRFFEWLLGRYTVQHCPIAKVWLLLAPTAAERSMAPELTAPPAGAAMEDLTKAIGWWYADMRALPRLAAESSRAVFFFSGHGLEIHQEKQVLLPADYLKPPAGTVNEALATDYLRKGLADLVVPNQFFFVDACRNDNQGLRELNVQGKQILNEVPASRTNSDRVVPVFYATASGTQAWQPTDPAEGISIFGEAVIDGLDGKPDISLVDCDGKWRAVNVFPMQSFLKGRVRQLLARRSATVAQPIRLGGVIDDVAITYVRPPVVATVVGGQPGHGPAPMVPPPPAPAGGPEPVLPERAMGVEWHRSGNSALDFSLSHAFLGSENVSELWTNHVEVVSLSDGSRLPTHDAFTIHDVERDTDTRAYRIDLSVPHDEHGHWFTIDDGETQFACVLPGDRHLQPRWVVDFDYEYEGTGDHARRWLSRFAVSLSPRSPGALEEIAKMWRRYHLANAREAVEHSAWELADLRDAVLHKLESPLAAAIGGLILLRLRRTDLIEQWLGNLSHWFERLPDAPVLWAEQLMREGRYEEAIGETLLLQRRGLPNLAEVLGLAATQVNGLLDSDDVVVSEQREDVALLSQRITRALRYFRNDGMLAVYSGRVASFGLELVRENAWTTAAV